MIYVYSVSNIYLCIHVLYNKNYVLFATTRIFSLKTRSRQCNNSPFGACATFCVFCQMLIAAAKVLSTMAELLKIPEMSKRQKDKFYGTVVSSQSK